MLHDSLRRSTGKLAGVNLLHTATVFAGGLVVMRVLQYLFSVSSEHFL